MRGLVVMNMAQGTLLPMFIYPLSLLCIGCCALKRKRTGLNNKESGSMSVHVCPTRSDFLDI